MDELRQLAGRPAGLQHHRHLLRQRFQRPALRVGELTDIAVQHTQRADRVAIGQHQRRAGIEPHTGRPGDQRVVIKP